MPYTRESAWRDDWPISDTKSRIGVTKFSPMGHDFPGGVKSGDVAYVFTDLVEHLAHYELPGEGCWGWSFRPNRNDAKKPSRHGAGIAIDYNAPRHPNGKKGTWTTAARAGIADLLQHRYGGCIRAGEFFHSTTDGMHFEINCSPAELAALVRDLKAHKAGTSKVVAKRPTRSLPTQAAPGWFHVGCPIGRNSEEVRAALKVLENPAYPPTAVLSPRISKLFGYVAQTYGLPTVADGRSALTADVARAIADWHRAR